jgi:hypothetical protein
VNSFPQPSANASLRHAAEEDNSGRGCSAATGHKSGDALTERGYEPQEKGYEPNTSGGRVGPGDQGFRSYTSLGAEEKRKGASVNRTSEED